VDPRISQKHWHQHALSPNILSELPLMRCMVLWAVCDHDTMISITAQIVHLASANECWQPLTQVLVSTTGGAAYTAKQLPQLLDDLGLHQQAAVFGTVRKLTKLDRADFRVRLLYIPLVSAPD